MSNSNDVKALIVTAHKEGWSWQKLSDAINEMVNEPTRANEIAKKEIKNGEDCGCHNTE